MLFRLSADQLIFILRFSEEISLFSILDFQLKLVIFQAKISAEISSFSSQEDIETCFVVFIQYVDKAKNRDFLSTDWILMDMSLLVPNVPE